MGGIQQLLCPPPLSSTCVCYLNLGAYSGTFHDAAEEEQVDVFGARGGGELAHIIRHLLHGWARHKDADKDKGGERDKRS